MNCRGTWSIRLFTLAAAVLVSVAGSFAQQQAAPAPQQQSGQQTTTQPAAHQGFWQRMKAAAQQQVQTEQQNVQNVTGAAAQQVGQTAQQAGQMGSQMVPATLKSPCGSLPGGSNAAGGNLAQASYSGGSCGGSGRCFDAGPFAAEVTQMTMSQQGWWHIIRMEVHFHNASNQPLIIAYHDGTSVMVDNLGNSYQGAGGSTGAVQGMGVDRGNSTDSQFVLAPGQTSSAMFSVARSRDPNHDALGTNFTYNLTVDELQPQNGAQALLVRQYNMNFPSLSPGNNAITNAAPGVATSNALPTGSATPAGGAVRTVPPANATAVRTAATTRGVAPAPAATRTSTAATAVVPATKAAAIGSKASPVPAAKVAAAPPVKTVVVPTAKKTATDPQR